MEGPLGHQNSWTLDCNRANGSQPAMGGSEVKAQQNAGHQTIVESSKVSPKGEGARLDYSGKQETGCGKAGGETAGEGGKCDWEVRTQQQFGG